MHKQLDLRVRERNTQYDFVILVENFIIMDMNGTKFKNEFFFH